MVGTERDREIPSRIRSGGLGINSSPLPTSTIYDLISKSTTRVRNSHTFSAEQETKACMPDVFVVEFLRLSVDIITQVTLSERIVTKVMITAILETYQTRQVLSSGSLPDSFVESISSVTISCSIICHYIIQNRFLKKACRHHYHESRSKGVLRRRDRLKVILRVKRSHRRILLAS